MERLRSHDQGFVAAAPAAVYGKLADPATYPSWWAGSKPEGDRVSLPLGRPAAQMERERDGIGLHLVFGNESLEWYLEPFEEGTIVNAFLDLRAAGSARRSARGLLRMRSSVRRGLVGLKKHLEPRP
jgi:hypothetical protein